MKSAIVFLSTLFAAYFADDTSSAIPDASLLKNETVGAAATPKLTHCPSPNNEVFAIKITHARVQQTASGGYRIDYRLTSGEIQTRCNCENADDFAFDRYFGEGRMYAIERANAPTVRCYSHLPKDDVLRIRIKKEHVPREMLAWYLFFLMQSEKNICATTSP